MITLTLSQVLHLKML